MNKTKIKLVALLVACGLVYTGLKAGELNTGDKMLDVTYLEEDYSGDDQELELEISLDGDNLSEEETSIANSENTIASEKEKTNDVVIATNDTTIYASNTDNSLKIANLKISDTAYRILSCDNNWDLIRYDGTLGYVCHDDVEYLYDGEVDIYDHQPLNDIVTTTTALNFRTAPTTESEVMSTLADNTELKVIAKTNNGWYLVSNNGNLGYVSMDYAESMLQKLKSEYPTLDLEEVKVEKIVYANSNLNVRNGASIDCEKIGQMEQYESARVLKKYDDWYLVLTNDYNFGFINKEYTEDLTDTFVVVDKSEQRLFMYNDNELYFTTPVTTGKDTTPSDTGLFSIYSKETNRYLTGDNYRSFVSYWMPYNGGEGLHDASWRSEFGTQSYKTSGSHGCVNLPTSIADDIYENVSIGTKVLVHK